MVRRIAEAAFSDGIIVGVGRVLLGMVVVCALAIACRGGRATAGVLMSLVWALVFGGLAGWRELVVTCFAPDRLLWHPVPGWGWPRRLALTACLVGAAWFFWTCLAAGFSPHGGLIAGVPFAASGLQRLVHAARPVAVQRAGIVRSQGEIGEP
jgi:hypothetical protein